MKKIFLLIPILILNGIVTPDIAKSNLNRFMEKHEWEKAYMYITESVDYRNNYLATDYIKMRYFEEIGEIDSSFEYAKSIVDSTVDTLFYDVVRIFGKSGNDSLIKKYCDMRNDSIIKLFYFLSHNRNDSLFKYISILPDSLFYIYFKFSRFGRKIPSFNSHIKRIGYDKRVNIYENNYMYSNAIKIRKGLLNYRGEKNIYNLAKDYYLTGKKEQAYYYFKKVLNEYPHSREALKSLNYLKKDNKIHGNSRYNAAEVYMNFKKYKSAKAVLKPLGIKHKKVRYLMGVCEYGSKNYKGAIKILYPLRYNNFYDASFYIGVSYYKIEQSEKAKLFLNYFIKNSKSTENIGEAYYRLAILDKKNSIKNYINVLYCDTKSYFIERALFAILEHGNKELYEDIINNYKYKNKIFTPKVLNTLLMMCIGINSTDLAQYYREYLNNLFPAHYYTILINGLDSDMVKTYDHNTDILNIISIGIRAGYASEAKKIFKHKDKKANDYLYLAKTAYKASHYSLSINYANKYINMCMENNKEIDSVVFKLLFPRGYSPIVNRYANEFNIDKNLIYAIIREESWFQRDVISRAGAIGLMQVMPQTFKMMGYYNRNNYFNPNENIKAGSEFIKNLLKRYNGSIFAVISHYNGGSIPARNANDSLFIEHIPYVETEKYIKNVLRSYEFYKKIYKDNTI